MSLFLINKSKLPWSALTGVCLSSNPGWNRPKTLRCSCSKIHLTLKLKVKCVNKHSHIRIFVITHSHTHTGLCVNRQEDHWFVGLSIRLFAARAAWVVLPVAQHVTSCFSLSTHSWCWLPLICTGLPSLCLTRELHWKHKCVCRVWGRKVDLSAGKDREQESFSSLLPLILGLI